MVDYFEQQRERGTLRTHPWVIGGVVVLLTAGTVLLVRRLFGWDEENLVLVWTLLAAIVIFGAARRLLARRAAAGATIINGDTIVRQDGTRMHYDARRHRRFTPRRRATVLHMRDGRQVPARIVDISIAGVAVEARLSDTDFLSIDRVGSRAAGPVRRTQRGAVFGFATLLEPQPFDASFVL